MHAVTVTISPDIARKLLAFTQEEITQLRRSLAEKERDLDQLKKSLAAGVGEPQASLPLSVSKTDTGRATKGSSEKVILSFLESHKGSGWRVSEVARQTGTSLSTTIRVLRRLAHSGKVSSANNTWGVAA